MRTTFRLSTEDLATKKRHMDAARVLLDYAGDVREGVKAFVEGSHFSEARRIVSRARLAVVAVADLLTIDRSEFVS